MSSCVKCGSSLKGLSGAIFMSTFVSKVTNGKIIITLAILKTVCATAIPLKMCGNVSTPSFIITVEGSTHESKGSNFK